MPAQIRDVMPAFELFQPASVADTLGLLDRHGADAWIMAGGMDTFDWLKDRIRKPRVVIDLAPLVSLPGRAVGLILSQHLRLQRLGGCLRLAQASASVATAMELVGLPSLIEVFPTLDEAVLSRWPG